MLAKFYIVAFTHKYVEINDIGKMHREGTSLEDGLSLAKQACKIDELVYLSTCNRVELMFFTSEKVNEAFQKTLFKSLLGLKASELKWAVNHSKTYQAEDALRHLFYVTSSIDSLVVGEREIITQVRMAFEYAEKLQLSGDFNRVVFRAATEVAKKVYSQTQVAHNPVSIVSLAFRKLCDLNLHKDTKFLIIGAGQTNSVLATYIKKKGFNHFTVANRTLDKAQQLAKKLKGKAIAFENLGIQPEHFDVLLYCTGADKPLVSEAIWKGLLQDSLHDKVVVDLAIPAGIEHEVLHKYAPTYIGISDLKVLARQNLDIRQREVEKCKLIVNDAIDKTITQIRQREVELALSFIPTQVKAIRRKATEDVFAKRLQSLDEPSKALVTDLLDYLEKKYIGLPMKVAREHLK